MIYQECLQLLFSKRERKMPKKFSQIQEVFQKLGNPQDTFPSIHIAGTNGKGSVAVKMAKTLEYAGYRVGLFTSPHIERFEERIQINGVEIPRDEVEKRLPFLMETFPHLCFFDYATFLAFQYFSENNIDVAVVETGIGGLHDTTNVVHPLVSVITSVSLDHIELLGPTLEDIAYQKAGIIKPQVPAVIGPKARFAPIFTQAIKTKSPLIEVEMQEGDYDDENRAIAQAALEQLKSSFVITEFIMKKGLSMKPSCRFERQGRFVLDVAHNPAGFESLLKAWDQQTSGKPMNAIVGLSSDKDLPACLRLIAQRANHLFLVQAETKRAASIEQLQKILMKDNITHFTGCQTIHEAIQQASARDHDILICGSFYIMKQAREEIFRLQVS